MKLWTWLRMSGYSDKTTTQNTPAERVTNGFLIAISLTQSGPPQSPGINPLECLPRLNSNIMTHHPHECMNMGEDVIVFRSPVTETENNCNCDWTVTEKDRKIGHS